MRKMNIEIYTKLGCPLCDQAKALCKVKGLEYTETSISSDRGLDMLKLYPMVRQMPAIFIDGQRVGGFAGFEAALEKMGL